MTQQNDPQGNTDFRCGTVAIVGRPNVGKSTLLNHILGLKLSITSRKAQTTRHRLLGIHTTEDTQYLFVDTPGFQQKHVNALNRSLNRTVTQVLTEVDVVLFVIEPMHLGDADRKVLKLLPADKPVLLVVNSSDHEVKITVEGQPFARVPIRPIHIWHELGIMTRTDEVPPSGRFTDTLEPFGVGVYAPALMADTLAKLKQGFTRYAPLGILIALIVIAQIGLVVWARNLGVEPATPPAPKPAGYSNTTELGTLLYTEFLYPFEVAAVILLVAIVAAITLTMRRRPRQKIQDINRQVAVRARDRIRVVKMDAEGGQ